MISIKMKPNIPIKRGNTLRKGNPPTPNIQPPPKFLFFAPL